MLAVKTVISFSVVPGKPNWSTGSLLRLKSEVNTWTGEGYRQREAGKITIRILANQWSSCTLAPAFQVGLGWGLHLLIQYGYSQEGCRTWDKALFIPGILQGWVESLWLLILIAAGCLSAGGAQTEH